MLVKYSITETLLLHLLLNNVNMYINPIYEYVLKIYKQA